jgi:hypothetical protein
MRKYTESTPARNRARPGGMLPRSSPARPGESHEAMLELQAATSEKKVSRDPARSCPKKAPVWGIVFGDRWGQMGWVRLATLRSSNLLVDSAPEVGPQKASAARLATQRRSKRTIDDEHPAHESTGCATGFVCPAFARRRGTGAR